MFNITDTSSHFVIIILQYNHSSVTIQCIESALRLRARSTDIVIVDNSSVDGSADVIRTKYSNNKSIHLICLEENLGFARGNNAGYLYAKKNLTPDFICMINNDITFPNKNTLVRAEKEYNKRKYDIMGPDVVVFRDKKKLHQNPLRLKSRSQAEIVDHINKLKAKIDGLETLDAAQMLPRLWGRTRKNKKRIQGNLVLHGSIYFFSKHFINTMDVPFDKETFMYGEEHLLTLRAIQKGMKIEYCPSISVLHHAGASTSKVSTHESLKFRYENMLKSALRYKEFLSQLN